MILFTFLLIRGAYDVDHLLNPVSIWLNFNQETAGEFKISNTRLQKNQEFF